MHKYLALAAFVWAGFGKLFFVENREGNKTVKRREVNPKQVKDYKKLHNA